MTLRYPPVLGIVSMVDADGERRAGLEDMTGHPLADVIDRY
jgi:hypothetical protein